ncbi:MAG: endonuclease/exonuclease/phosphatase, partial [Chitinophagaceae bacterium]
MKQLSVLISIVALYACSHKVAKVASSEKDLLKVMSYNIHHCNPPSAGSEINVDTIAAVIRKYNPDLVALQEVDVKTKRSGSVDQARLLGEKTGMQYYFFKAINHDGGEYGVAILSKEPVTSFKQYTLPTIPSSKGEPRILSTINIKTREGKELLFACTHLDAQRSDSNRLLQIEEIRSR